MNPCDECCHNFGLLGCDRDFKLEKKIRDCFSERCFGWILSRLLGRCGKEGRFYRSRIINQY